MRRSQRVALPRREPELPDGDERSRETTATFILTPATTQPSPAAASFGYVVHELRHRRLRESDRCPRRRRSTLAPRWPSAGTAQLDPGDVRRAGVVDGPVRKEDACVAGVVQLAGAMLHTVPSSAARWFDAWMFPASSCHVATPLPARSTASTSPVAVAEQRRVLPTGRRPGGRPRRSRRRPSRTSARRRRPRSARADGRTLSGVPQSSCGTGRIQSLPQAFGTTKHARKRHAATSRGTPLSPLCPPIRRGVCAAGKREVKGQRLDDWALRDERGHIVPASGAADESPRRRPVLTRRPSGILARWERDELVIGTGR